MTSFPCTIMPEAERLPTVGLIVLQADETIEQDFRRLFPAEACDFFVSRVRSDPEVTTETLAAMANDMTAAASLFPRSAKFDVVGYGCTSGTSGYRSRAGCRVGLRWLYDQGCHRARLGIWFTPASGATSSGWRSCRHTSRALARICATCWRRTGLRRRFFGSFK